VIVRWSEFSSLIEPGFSGCKSEAGLGFSAGT
jgi:hypothetical protein